MLFTILVSVNPKSLSYHKPVQQNINRFSVINKPLLHSKSIKMYPFEHVHLKFWHDSACSLPVHWLL